MDRNVGISSRQWGKLSDWRMGNQRLEVALRNYLQGPESISAPGWRQKDDALSCWAPHTTSRTVQAGFIGFPATLRPARTSYMTFGESQE